MKRLHLIPAYGRTYSTQKAAAEDWAAGKDFRIVGGPYCSIRDSAALAKDGYTHAALQVGRSIKNVILNPKET